MIVKASREWKRIFLEIHQKFEGHLQAALQFKDEEDLHQVRVEIRKLLTMMEVLIVQEDTIDQNTRTANETADQLIYCFNTLKKLLKRFGKLRDWDVFYLQVTAIGKKWKGKSRKELENRLLMVINYHRQCIRTSLLMKIPDLYGIEFKRAWRQSITMKFLSGKLQKVDVGQSYQRLLEEFLDKYKAYDKIVIKKGMRADQAIEYLHEVRLASKKLRYSGKYLAFALENNIDRNVKGYKKIQGFLGNINDYANYLECINILKKKYTYLKCKTTQRVEKEIEKRLEASFSSLHKELKKNKKGKSKK